jgi:4,5-dihydroxyphthalate decarboxylase
MVGGLSLSIALAENERTRPLIDGRIRPQGIDLIPTVLHGSEVFWRQLKYADFDVSDMSLASLFIAASRGDDTWVGLPIYPMRRFFHTEILVRRDAGIRTPADLRGRRVGVPEYQQTSAIWSRGILEDEFGVAASEIEWFMERGPDRSHGSATGFTPPPGVRLNQIPSDTSIGQMLLRGELDATLLYLTDRNLVDRSRADISVVTEPLFRDREAEGKRYYAATGLYPINHAMAIRRSLLEKHPWIALNLFTAFCQARDLLFADATSALKPHLELGLVPPGAAAALGTDPIPYGFKTAKHVLDTIARYLHAQGLTPRQIDTTTVFAPSTLDV